MIEIHARDEFEIHARDEFEIHARDEFAVSGTSAILGEPSWVCAEPAPRAMLAVGSPQGVATTK